MMKIKWFLKYVYFHQPRVIGGRFILNCNELCNNYALLLSIEAETLIDLKGFSAFKLD